MNNISFVYLYLYIKKTLSLDKMAGGGLGRDVSQYMYDVVMLILFDLTLDHDHIVY